RRDLARAGRDEHPGHRLDARCRRVGRDRSHRPARATQRRLGHRLSRRSIPLERLTTPRPSTATLLDEEGNVQSSPPDKEGQDATMSRTGWYPRRTTNLGRTITRFLTLPYVER